MKQLNAPKICLLLSMFLTSFYGMASTTLLFQQDTTKKKTEKPKEKKEKSTLPLEGERKVQFTTSEGTWLSLDVSPKGDSIVFDMMGDLYMVGIAGGKARNVTRGMAYDVHPRFSPDGKSLVFVSDSSGSDNIWTLELATNKYKQITKDKNQHYFSAEWSTDGNYIIGARGRRNIKLHMYHKNGGGGVQLIETPANLKTIDPAVSPDGKLVYYSNRFSAWNYNAQLPQYQIATYNLEDGKTSRITSRYGSAFTPTLSPDGKWLVYGSRFEDNTGLMLQDLKTGDERWLAYPVQRDEQESIAPLGVLPAMSFTPDSKNLVASYGGKIYSIPVAGGSAQEIPFEVDLDLDLGPRLAFKYPIKDETEMVATQIRDAVPSPDGSKVTFTALNRLYIMDFPNGTPQRVTKMEITEAQPKWSPDGQWIVFTTWSAEGGHLYKVNTVGKAKPVQLTPESAIYSSPTWSYNSNRIVFTRGTAQAYKNGTGPFVFGSATDLCWIDANGGAVNFIDKSRGRGNPHFVKGDDRIYLNDFSRGLISMRWDGTDEKEHIAITGITTYGSIQDIIHEHSNGNVTTPSLLPQAYDVAERSQPSRAAAITMAPEGDQAMAQINNDIYLVTVPKMGKAAKISVANPESASFPSKKLTTLGGEFPQWLDNGKQVHWSLGNGYFVYDLDDEKVFSDSVKAAKEAEKLKKEEEKNDDDDDKEDKDEEGDDEDKDDDKKVEEKKSDDKKEEKKKDTYEASEKIIEVTVKRDVPKGKALLKGARIITMKGDEVIENGDILIENARIKAVGPAGSLAVPSGTEIIDMGGKTIVCLVLK